MMRIMGWACAIVLWSVPQAPALDHEASFARFDSRARAGEALNVVFFGASLTWGSNATDPNITGFRGRVAEALRTRYPQAPFRFRDAGLGGTGSQLGVFRLQRDVLAHKPDLVFLDFSANDGIKTAAPETMASYESLVRRIVRDGGCPVVIVVFPFKWNIAQGNTAGMLGRDGHLAIAAAYGVPVGDAIVLAQQRVEAGSVGLDELYPIDAVHPGDKGYALFAEAAMQGYARGVNEEMVCRIPEKMLHGDTCMRFIRQKISAFEDLPAGWEVGRAKRTSAWFDALMSRWLDDVTVASNYRRVRHPESGMIVKERREVSPLRVEFEGSTVLVFGEKTPQSGAFTATIDGKPVVRGKEGAQAAAHVFDANSADIGGNTHLTHVIASGLAPEDSHLLEIHPVLDAQENQELRIESICVAGGAAAVRWVDDVGKRGDGAR